MTTSCRLGRDLPATGFFMGLKRLLGTGQAGNWWTPSDTLVAFTMKTGDRAAVQKLRRKAGGGALPSQ